MAEHKIPGGRLGGGLAGETGLLVAVLDRAVRDALGSNPRHRASAWAYFHGPEYRHHLELLERPLQLPAAFLEVNHDNV